jgi:hypothetical protein
MFSVRSARLCERVISLGRYGGAIDPTPKASLHFWRGVMDGDANLGLYRHPTTGRVLTQLRLFGEERLLNAYSSFVESSGIGRPTVRPHKSIFVASTGGARAASIAALLYNGSVPVLERKAALARHIVANQEITILLRSNQALRT